MFEPGVQLKGRGTLQDGSTQTSEETHRGVSDLTTEMDIDFPAENGTGTADTAVDSASRIQ